MLFGKWSDLISGGQGTLDGGFLVDGENKHYHAISNCNPENRWAHYTCSNSGCGKFQSWKPYDACNDHYCLGCAGRYGSRKGVEIFERLRVFRADVGYYVFTVPDRFWDRLFDRKKLARFAKAQRETLKEFYSKLTGVKKKDLLLGGCDRPHTWGDKTPENLGRIEPHGNVLIPLIAWDKSKKRFIKLPYYLNNGNLALLRGLWRKNIIKAFGWDLPENVVVNYHYKPFRYPEVLMNACQYVMRPPLEIPLNRDRFGGRGYDVVNFPYSRLFEILKHFQFYEGWMGLRWWGFMACGVVKKYLRLFGLDEKAVTSFFEGSIVGRCPYCGSGLSRDAEFMNGELYVLDIPVPWSVDHGSPDPYNYNETGVVSMPDSYWEL